MENKIINERANIMNTVKKFRENLTLHDDKSTERELKLLEKSIKFQENLANDKDENDFDYLIDRSIYFKGLFNSFLAKYNIDQAPEEQTINNSIFIETPEWLKLKGSVLNPHNRDNKCFQYSVTLSLYHEQIGRYCCRIPTVKPFIDSFNWENINFLPKEQDNKTFEINNKSIALNVLHTQSDEKISHLYKSEFNKTREKQVILLIILGNEKQHYVAVKNLNYLLKDKGKCSEHFCVNCFKKFRTKQKLKKHQGNC